MKTVKVKASNRKTKKGKVIRVKPHSRNVKSHVKESRINQGYKIGMIRGGRAYAETQILHDDLANLLNATTSDLAKSDKLLEKFFGKESLEGGAPISHVLTETNNPKIAKKYHAALKSLYTSILRRPKGSWRVRIPEEGHWPIQGNFKSKKEATSAYLKWAGRKKLPSGAYVDHPDEPSQYKGKYSYFN